MSVRRTIVRMAKRIAPDKLLIEQTSKFARGRIDRDAGIVYDVKVCGLDSKNGRTYTPESLKGACALYERINVNIDHPDSETDQTPLARRFGYLEGVHWADSPSPGLYANLVYNPKHSRADEIIEAADRMPHTLGLSHNAYAKSTRPGPNGTVVIESIAEVRSVDLVADPATNKGLYESHGTKPMKQTIKALIETAFNFPFQKKLWEGFAKDEDAAKRITEEIETPDGSSALDAANAAFDALATGIATDGSLNPKETGEKIAAVKTVKNKMLNGEEETPTPDPKKDDGKPKESVIGVTKAGRLCESLKFQPNIKQLTLISESTEAQAKELAEEFARLALVKPEQTPTSAARWEVVQESKANQPTQPAATAEELAARIR